MTLPADYDTVTVRGGYVYLDGSPAAGRVTFTGKTIATSAATRTMIVPATITATLDNTGRFEIQLPATNDPDIQPNGWTYKVEEKFNAGGGRTFEIDVPVSAKESGIELATVAPAIPSQGSPTAFVTLTEFHRHLADGETGGGGPSGPVAWNEVTGKPDTFPPATHQHAQTDIAGLGQALAGKADAVHGHGWSEVTGKPTSYPPAAHAHGWAEIADKPASFTPATHAHGWSEISGKPADFPPTAHGHAWGEVTGKPATYPPATHSHVINDVSGLQDALDSKLSNASISNKVDLNATSTQVVQLSATTTWLRGTVAYSAADDNADQEVWFAGHPTGGAPIKVKWRNGNNESRKAPSTPNRVADRVFEMAESAGLGPSVSYVWQVSTNPTRAADRVPLAGVLGTGHPTMPGYMTLHYGIDAPNLKPTDWQALTMGAATATGGEYDAPQARGEYPDLTRLRGCVNIPASTPAGTTLFTVPAPLRPTKTKRISVRTTGSNIATVLFIRPDGTASFNIASGAAGELGLDDIDFAR